MRFSTLTRFLAGLTLSTTLAGGAIGADEIRPDQGLLRYPDVSKTHVAFVYANDIWIVPREGGKARPLASPPGAEALPRFNPDGTSIAFLGNYEGNNDIYVVPVEGGIARRVTHHPASERLDDWSSPDSIVFSMNGLAGLGRQQQIFRVSPSGGMPERLPVPYGAAGAISPDGTWLAYTPHNRDGRTWKRYRGGLASDVWLFNLKTGESKRITDWEGTDTIPMWHGETVYYLSDAGESARLNIWKFDTRTEERSQVTDFTDHDVKWPAMGPGENGGGEIVFQNGSSLHLLDLASGETRSIDVTMPGDRPTLRPRRVDVSEFIADRGISSTGKRVAIEARGDVWTVPAKHGPKRNLTNTDGVAERDPAWSPDGRWIAYFSDESGEYELHLTQSDGKGETKQLTKDSRTFYESPVWSPNSERLVFTDKAGRILLHTIESGETIEIDRDPYALSGGSLSPSWSSDGNWLAYARTSEEAPTRSIWLYDVASGEKHRVTAELFDDSTPAFDRKGDWLYFASSRHFSPSYDELGTNFIYDNTQVLLAVPLREDVKSPWLPKSDEETWEDEAETPEDEAAAKDEAEGDGEGADEADEADAAAPTEDPIAGTWSGTATGEGMEGPLAFTLSLTRGEGNAVSGHLDAGPYSGPVTGGFDPATNKLNLALTLPDGTVITFDLSLVDGRLTGSAAGDGTSVTIEATRQATEADAEDGEKADEASDEPVKIDLEGFESRAMALPVPPGRFGRLAVNDKGQLVYARLSSAASNAPSIQLFDLNDETKAEKTIAAGVGSFDLSADGSTLLLVRGDQTQVQPATAGGAAEGVDTSNMIARIDPRAEWRQIFTDAWRIHRDFFYDPNMHGVDWEGVRDRYGSMLEDCVTRQDLSYLIGEMISELNVGHAYYWGGDIEEEPNTNVGLLGVDFAPEGEVYKITRIVAGGPWDVDARGPLNQPGLDVKEGDYLLEVNGVPVTTERDPWAPFVGLAGRTVILTVSAKPEKDETARELIVQPAANEGDLRYRAWVESNRRYVEEKSDGRVGYLHVPDTGVNGQNELIRQFFGQLDKDALIIDERWNGGGQIPTRFIELLNRPVTNYWARRDGKTWTWPPDSHQGPKCMLINGPSGSGGDAFPYYFRQAGLGKLIGTRTWGGLVGISGNPGLIDGGYTAVPTFAFYETDGTWGVEGHGVDPDLLVVDDPAKMQDGGDPQLDAAISLMLEEIQANPYMPVEKPAYPDRSGMGITDEDK